MFSNDASKIIENIHEVFKEIACGPATPWGKIESHSFNEVLQPFADWILRDKYAWRYKDKFLKILSFIYLFFENFWLLSRVMADQVISTLGVGEQSVCLWHEESVMYV